MRLPIAIVSFFLWMALGSGFRTIAPLSTRSRCQARQSPATVALTPEFRDYGNRDSPTQLFALFDGSEVVHQSLLLVASDESSRVVLDPNWTNWAVFLVGVLPFAWATVEFWRRIAVGEPFGTGSDSVFIGKDNAPEDSRGRRILDRGALTTAYILFAVAAAVLGIALFAVLGSSPPPVDFPPSSSSNPLL